MAETFLAIGGIGPMSFITPDTLVLCFLSSSPYRRRYEEDLVSELRQKGLGRIVGIVPEESADGSLFDECIPASAGQIRDELRVPFEIPFAQLLAYHLSRKEGLDPDNPSPTGAITRVVQQITCDLRRGSRVFECLVAGDVNVDLLMDGVIALEPGTEKLAQSMNLVLGGSSAITAFNLSKLGRKVAFTGVVGQDLLGRFVEEKLASGGVDIRWLSRSDTEKTGLTIWHSCGGERAGVTYQGTIAMLEADEISNRMLKSARTALSCRGLFRSEPAARRCGEVVRSCESARTDNLGRLQL